MKPSEDQKLIELVKVTGEIYGKQVSLAAALMFLADLDGYQSGSITSALAKCRRELRTFPTVADVIARIDDGRPGVEEAWAMLPKCEADSVVWSDEMAAAFNAVRDMIQDDPVAARMAFKEVYSRTVAEARCNGVLTNWTPSLGHDPRTRAEALRDAVDKKRISIEHAVKLDPQIEQKPIDLKRLGFDVGKLLPEIPLQ